jgi:rhamnulokinase
MSNRIYAAIDLGASSGRVMLGTLSSHGFSLEEVHRFPNGAHLQDGAFVWDMDSLFNEIIIGLKRCKELGKIPSSIAIDSWGVDYALIDEKGATIPPVFCYRDARGGKAADHVHKALPFEQIYARDGIQFEPFNTLYQLVADQKAGRLAHAVDFLMVPAYLSYRLSGVKCHEYCDASTTGLLDPKSKKWDKTLIKELGLPEALFHADPKEPPFILGPLKEEIAQAVGFQASIIMVASHDTASSVVALPSAKPCLFLSSGTWSLLGVELAEPSVTPEGGKANFTNEGGVGEIRYLKNLMGLWLVQCLQKEYPAVSFPEMASLAEKKAGFDYALDIDDPRYLMPKKVTAVIQKDCKERGYPIPHDVGEYAYAIYCSLANDYARTIKQLEAITHLDYANLYVVGGGRKNLYLNRLIEEKTGKHVVLGSGEATSLGNVALQALCQKDVANYDEMKQRILLEEDK